MRLPACAVVAAFEVPEVVAVCWIIASIENILAVFGPAADALSLVGCEQRLFLIAAQVRTLTLTLANPKP